ncbi:hypothetical protein [Streptomyces sp. GS7]|uniref:hypothetical protein n=1 Tax=Streptomyces sp. GS7 TaxID=2692234 RepID=UPI001317CD81|nr:hypothetical protein [Streptomyces sp. GS7]QHC20553.1 hypothetical protein GR130_02960 [Streptomyces sp. GS7]
MTRTMKSFAVAALALAALGGASMPAMADNHLPIAANSATTLDSHAPMAPQDSHAPFAPLDSHAP